MYDVINDFHAGVDTRKGPFTSKPGTLLVCRNGHITRGGEIEKRKAFVPFSQLPTGLTFGQQACAGNIYVFGSTVTPASLPPNVQYQQLISALGVGDAMTSVLFTENFNGTIYAIAQFASGSIYHYYGGVRVTTWDGIASTVADSTGVASLFATLVSNEPYFTATFLGAVCTITSKENNQPFTISGSAAQGSTATSLPTITIATTQAAGASQPQISTVTIGGGFDPSDLFTLTLGIVSIPYQKVLTISGESAGIGLTAKTFNTIVYSTARSLLYFCQVNDPTQWGTNVNGSGNINMTNQSSGSENLTGIGVFLGKMAIFSRRATQVWNINADPTQNTQSQVINTIGTFAPKSIVNNGDIDLFFLSDAGIRSLRPRDASNITTVSDLGTNIDTLLQQDLLSLTPAQKQAATAIMEPTDGRYWLAVGPRVYTYSSFPTPGIQAWSWYEPGFNITELSYNNGQIYARAGDTIYLYGGADNNTYDSTTCTAQIPFIDGGKPGTFKIIEAMDACVDGTWGISVATDAAAPNVFSLPSIITGQTYSKQKIGCVGKGTHVSVQMQSMGTEYARISNLVIYFDGESPK